MIGVSENNTGDQYWTCWFVPSTIFFYGYKNTIYPPKKTNNNVKKKSKRPIKTTNSTTTNTLNEAMFLPFELLFIIIAD